MKTVDVRSEAYPALTGTVCPENNEITLLRFFKRVFFPPQCSEQCI